MNITRLHIWRVVPYVCGIGGAAMLCNNDIVVVRWWDLVFSICFELYAWSLIIAMGIVYATDIMNNPEYWKPDVSEMLK